MAGCASTTGNLQREAEPSTLKAQTPALDREALLKLSYNFLKNGDGIDQGSQLVFERLTITDNQISRWDNRTQPTSNGFYIQFLIDVAMGNAEVDFISSFEATVRLNQLLDTLLSMQKQYGWKGFYQHLDISKIAVM